MSIGYYSYLAISQSDGVIRKKGYGIDHEDVVFTSYFSQSFPKSVVSIIRKDFDSPFYLCRTPFHLVGPGIPFNSGSIQYSATEEEIAAIKTSIPEGMPDINPDSAVIARIEQSDDEDFIKSLSLVILDQALLQEGVMPADPAAFASNLTKLLS